MVNLVWILWTMFLVLSLFYPYIAVAFLGWRYVVSIIRHKPWREEEGDDGE